MKLDLTEIAHSIGMQYTYEVVDDQDRDHLSDSGVILGEPVHGKIVFSNAGPLLLARGSIDTVVELECARCLRMFRSQESIQIEEMFPLHPVNTPGEAVDDDKDEMEPADLALAEDLYHDGILDLTELIRQNLIVALPLAPVCKEDCEGLCPHCGANWNEGKCNCSSEEVGDGTTLRDALFRWKQENKD